MTHHHHNICCSSSSSNHHHDDEFDPCMAKEIAQMERHRILYEKMKAQSDKMLMNLNIRTAKHRVRGSVAPDHHDEDSDEAECAAGECSHEKKVLQIIPSLFNTFALSNKGCRVIMLCIPCDYQLNGGSSDEVSATEKVFSDVCRDLPCKKKDVVLGKFSKPVCICGKCEDSERQPTGSLRSVAMLLKCLPSVVVTRNGGLQGIWSSSQGDLDQFLKKHLS